MLTQTPEMPWHPARTPAWHDFSMTGTAHDNDWDRRRPSRGRRVLIGIVVVCGLVLLYLIASWTVPRWWAHRVGDVVDGQLTVGALFGLFIGFLFTAAPLGVAWTAIRLRSSRRTWKGWLGWLGVAALAALPNLMTIGIVAGNSDAAHDGDRILSVEGNGFRVWSFVGGILAVVAIIGIWYLAHSRRMSRRKATEYRDELRARDQST